MTKTKPTKSRVRIFLGRRLIGTSGLGKIVKRLICHTCSSCDGSEVSVLASTLPTYRLEFHLAPPLRVRTAREHEWLKAKEGQPVRIELSGPRSKRRYTMYFESYLYRDGNYEGMVFSGYHTGKFHGQKH